MPVPWRSIYVGEPQHYEHPRRRSSLFDVDVSLTFSRSFRLQHHDYLVGQPSRSSSRRGLDRFHCHSSPGRGIATVHSLLPGPMPGNRRLWDRSGNGSQFSSLAMRELTHR